jgi:RNA polymerase sigma-70 factor (ECF subfamily)
MPASTSDAFSPGAREFRTTHWSMVLRAGESGARAREALSKLCAAYWYPLYAYVRRQGHPAPDAQDLTQEFFARLLARGDIGGVDPGRGRFRTWLLAALQHFLINEWHRARTQKRGGGAPPVSLDDDAEAHYGREPADPLTAEKLFDRRWALTLLDRVLARLGSEMAGMGKAAQFEALKFCLSGEKHAYGEIALSLGMTEGAVKVAVHRLRERYRALIRAEIAETVADPSEVDAELRDLFAALSD